MAHRDTEAQSNKYREDKGHSPTFFSVDSVFLKNKDSVSPCLCV